MRHWQAFIYVRLLGVREVHFVIQGVLLSCKCRESKEIERDNCKKVRQHEVKQSKPERLLALEVPEAFVEAL